MKLKIASVLILTLVVALVLVPGAMAVSQSTINAIVKDAQDGHLDGNWTKAEVQAALNYVRNHPINQQYSDVEAVLEGFLSGQRAGSRHGQPLVYGVQPAARIRRRHRTHRRRSVTSPPHHRLNRG